MFTVRYVISLVHVVQVLVTQYINKIKQIESSCPSVITKTYP